MPTFLNSFYQKDRVLPISAPRRSNPFWDDSKFPCILCGSILTLLGISLIPIEVSRIISGSLNRGTSGVFNLYPNYNADSNSNVAYIKTFQNNFVETNLANKGIVPFSATAAGQSPHNFPIQDKYLWPWSHAALLFSLISIAAGILGILSGFRETYSTLFIFFALSLFSAFMSIFLVVYYSTHLYWQRNQNIANRQASSYSNLDMSLGIVMLVLSSCLCLMSFISSIIAGLSTGICMGAKARLLKKPDIKFRKLSPSYAAYKSSPFYGYN